MGSIRSRQGSATLSSARGRTPRLLLAVTAALVVAFLGAAPAMAADISVTDGELTFTAAVNVANQVTISGDSSSITVTDPTDPIPAPGAGCTSVDPLTVVCEGVSQLNIRVRDFDDVVTNDSAVPSIVHGLNGNDTLTGGSGADELRGANGDDVLDGRGGNDTLVGDGDDTVGDDQLIGGDGVDLANFGSAAALTIDLGTTAPQMTGDGMDSLSGVENINGSTSGDRLIGDGSPNTLLGKGGDDEIRIRDGGSDAANCGTGWDLVVLDRNDTLLDPHACEEINDGAVPSGTTITAGPSGLTNDPTWHFTSDEPWARFECAIVENADQLSTATWNTCRSGEPIAAPEGSSVFAVRAFDDQENRDPNPATRAFTLDTVAPGTRIDSGPSGGAVISDPTPEFFFSSPDDDTKEFYCRFDGGLFLLCSTPLTADPLADGPHTFEVTAVDAAGNGNFDQTPAKVNFTVDTIVRPGPGDGPAPDPQAPPPASNPPQAQQAKIIIGSLVLISGNRVRMSRKGRVRIRLTCAGAARCSGRLSVTTAEPLSKRRRKLVTLGAKRFRIGANKKRRINVRFSKRKQRIAKRLKRFKAKAVIREIDARGNLRISSRILILRAR